MVSVEILAVWGAVTGTIGTLAGVLGFGLRLRQYLADKPRLKNDVEFRFGGMDGGEPSHLIYLRSTGRRPVSIDYIEYHIRPSKFFDRMFVRWLRRDGRWVHRDKLFKPLVLEEGKKVQVGLARVQGMPVTSISGIFAIDQTGRSWKVRWPSRRKVAKLATSEKITSVNFEGDRRNVEITQYRVGDKYKIHLFIKDTGGGPSRGHVILRRNIEDSDALFNFLSEIMVPKYLSKEIDADELIKEVGSFSRV
ncbi:MAG TPA: hypothetical protein DCM48_05770 [Thalassospira sp.]|nr:hypothetical protein [Thalassospira sp.]